MKLFKNLRYVIASLGVVVLLTSAIPASKEPVPSERVKAASAALDIAVQDGKLSYKELKSIATDLKGKKLSLKEKIALKVFGKKISKKATSAPFADGKSQVIALILCAFVGGLGVHRFYLGYIWQGVVQLLTAGGCGIWWLIDLIRIITGDLQPKDGEYETTL